MRPLINCDIGERGPDHPVDRRLMEVVHLASLACGGHAGDAGSVKVFRALAEKNGVRLAAHLSYPDRPNFGRKAMTISGPALLASLEEQLGLLPGVRRVKFHGALYNEASRDAVLAKTLARWLKRAGIREILAPAGAEITRCAGELGIAVLREAFAERRYEYNAAARRLELVDRSRPRACLTGIAPALEQAGEIGVRQRVNTSRRESGRPVWRALPADTICIHSDSPIALELAVKLRQLESFRLSRPGVCETVGLPLYGSQDLAVTPGGAMDCFSLRRGNLMLGNPPGAPALEILVPPEIEISAAGRFVLTGARRPARIRSGNTVREAGNDRAYSVEPGARITFGEKQYGLRTYFCFRPGVKGGKDRGSAEAVPFSSLNAWADPGGRIRVVPGPEYERLEEPQLFLASPWRTTSRMDRMGMHLEGNPHLKCVPAGMISEAVADGTVQLAPGGPIILLRHRQTTGGYPRIFNVITADVDLLGQYGPGQVLRFAQVSLEEAREAARRKELALEGLRTGPRGAPPHC